MSKTTYLYHVKAKQQLSGKFVMKFSVSEPYFVKKLLRNLSKCPKYLRVSKHTLLSYFCKIAL
jgi:hypothetical protein